VTPPDVRVVRGAPDDVELAALVAGLAAGTTPHEHHPVERVTAEGRARRRWRDAAQPLRDPLAPGADTWRWSAHAAAALR
jgi:hypothetical protein